MKRKTKLYRGAFNRNIILVLIGAFFLRITLAIFLYIRGLKHNNIGLFLGLDDSFYWGIGTEIASFWQSNKFIVFPSKMGLGNYVNGYYFLNALFHYLFADKGVVLLLILNSIIGTLVVYYTYLVASKVGGKTVGIKSSFIIAILPRFVFWSSLNFRDVYLALFLLLFIFSLINQSSDSKKNVILFALGLIGTLWFRPWQGILLVIIFFFLLLYPSVRSNIYKSIPKHFALLCLVLGLLISSQFVGQGFERMIDYIHRTGDLYWEGAEISSSSGSLFMPYFRLGFFGRMLLFPVSVIISLIYPFPVWTVGNSLPRDIEIISNLFWYPLIPLAIAGIIKQLFSSKFSHGVIASIIPLGLFLGFQLQGPILLQRTAYSIHVFFIIFSVFCWIYFPKLRMLSVFSIFTMVFLSIGYIILKRDMVFTIISSLIVSLVILISYLKFGNIKISNQ